MAIALDVLANGELMGDAGMLLVPATAAFMLVERIHRIGPSWESALP